MKVKMKCECQFTGERKTIEKEVSLDEYEALLNAKGNGNNIREFKDGVDEEFKILEIDVID